MLRTLRHDGPVRSVAFSSDGRQILTGSWDGTAKLWDSTSGDLLRTFEGHTNYILSVAFSPDGQRIVTGSRDQTAKVWDAATGNVRHSRRARRCGMVSGVFPGWQTDRHRQLGWDRQGVGRGRRRPLVTFKGTATRSFPWRFPRTANES